MVSVAIKDIEMIAKERNVPVYVIIDEIVKKELKKKMIKNLVKRIKWLSLHKQLNKLRWDYHIQF